jgi:hypothetical protein
MSKSQDFMNEFKAAVLAHLKTKVDHDTFENFREHARTGLAEEPIDGSENWTREDLVEGGVTIGAGAPQEILKAFSKALIIEIGTIQNRPIRFVVQEGIYIWALTDDDQGALELWITCPAYPPGW